MHWLLPGGLLNSMSRFSYHIPILGFHRIGPHRPDHVPTVTAEAFEKQLGLLAKWRYSVISFNEVVSRMEKSLPIPRKAVVITFDDGYEDNYLVAWPLLRKFAFPAIVFVTPTEVSTKGFATWQQLREMAGDGFEIGSHTMHHSYMPTTPDEKLKEEVADSKTLIEQQLGKRIDFLSYPIGGYTPQAQAMAKQAGYRAACTTNRGVAYAMTDRFAIRRVKITDGDANPLVFRAKLSGHYDAFRKLKRPS